jgi:predicted membrane protein
MNIAFYDIVGAVGVTLVLGTYAALQAGRMAADGLLYSVLNLAGAIFIGYSLLFAFNLASFTIEVFWASASAFGIWRALKRRRAPAPDRA